jgi:ADP-ribosylglycohydrolase
MTAPDANNDPISPNDPISSISQQSRYHGALLGLAVGDALGTTLEFQPAGSFAPIQDIVGGGPFQLQAGEWTDDTALALCLAESLVLCGAFDAYDQMQRYVRWMDEGYYSVKGYCFDIGGTTARALNRFKATDNPFAGDRDGAGNGSLMRLAPVPLAFAATPVQAIQRAGDSSRTTHGAPQAVDACRYLAALLVGAVQGVSKADLLAPAYTPAQGIWEQPALHPEIDAIAAGSYKHKHPPDIRGGGYVVASLEAALWAFYHSESFREGCLLAVNLGDDADTTGAVYGQLAGAYYGSQGIPADWRACIAMDERIEELAAELFALAYPH